MTHEQIRALGFTPADDLPEDMPHPRAYLLIEEYDGSLVYALAEWDPQIQIGGKVRHAGGFAVLHEFGNGPRIVNDPARPNLRLRYWKTLEQLNDEGGE